MLSKEEAIESVKSELDDDMDVMMDSIIEKDYGWVIFSQTKKYIESGNFFDATIGSGGVLVEKKTGNKYHFGSVYSIEKNLDYYEKGYFRYENWDIVVTRINDMQRAKEYLSKLRISYVQPEVAHGTEWKIPKEYTHKQLKTILSKLPARFNLGKVYFLFDELESLKKQSDLIYTLEENNGYANRI